MIKFLIEQFAHNIFCCYSVGPIWCAHGIVCPFPFFYLNYGWSNGLLLLLCVVNWFSEKFTGNIFT